ncbi:MAG: HEPN domain-containing protein [bacterium]
MEESRDRNKELNGRDYIVAARERLKNAKILLEAEGYADSVSRSYYAMLDAASAALLTKDIRAKSHTGVIDLFSLHFIKTNLVDTKYIRWFKRIKKDREEADYKHQKKFSKEDAEETYLEAVEFVKMVEGLFLKL